MAAVADLTVSVPQPERHFLLEGVHDADALRQKLLHVGVPVLAKAQGLVLPPRLHLGVHVAKVLNQPAADNLFSDFIDSFGDVGNRPIDLIRMRAGHIEAPRPPGCFVIAFHVRISRNFRNSRPAKERRRGSNGSGAYSPGLNSLS